LDYTHQLALTTAYDDSIMPFTNYTLDFKGMIDYMLSSPSLARYVVD
jgi:mRNA deadenylase 3'-5' endonuclease subunit Ccr4